MRIAVAVLMLIFSVFASKAQVYSIPQYALDSAVKHTFRGEVGALMKVSYEEKDDRVDWQFNATLGLEYISIKHDFRFNLDWYYERGTSPGDSTLRAYLLAGAGLFKYKYEDGRLVERKMFVAPVYIYQHNSDRGLEWRHQVGVLLQPYGYKTRKLWFNVLIGFVYNYASWDILNNDILPNGGAGVGIKGRSQIVKEFEPMLMLNFFYKPTRLLSVDFTGYIQQPTVNPNPQIARGFVNDVSKLYPHVLMDLNVKYQIVKGLSLQAKIKADFERTRPTVFKKGFEWNTMLGLNWKFTTLKSEK